MTTDTKIGLYTDFTPDEQIVISNFLKLILMDDMKSNSIMLCLIDDSSITGVFICVKKEEKVWFVQYHGENNETISRQPEYLTMISDFVSIQNQKQTNDLQLEKEQIIKNREEEILSRHHFELYQLQTRIDIMNKQEQIELLKQQQELEIKQQLEQPLFIHEQQKMSIDNFIQVIFSHSKISQIGNMSDRVFVQELKYTTREGIEQYQDFLSKNCGFSVDKEIKNNEKIIIFFSLNNTLQMSGFQYIKYDIISGIAERYSSCTGTLSRRQGVMKKIDITATSYMQLKFPNLKYIWTGLKITDFTIENAKKESARKIKSGFGWDLQITNTTPLNMKTPFRFLSFYWKPGSYINNKQLDMSITRSNNLIDSYQRTLYIPLHIINGLRDLRVRNPTQEYAGHFERDPTNGEVTNFVSEPLPTIPEYIVDGKPITCNVPISIHGTHIFSFHTHPDGCYIAYNQGLGWPSSPDLQSILRFATLPEDQGLFLDRISTIHFVMASEGIYAIRLSKDLVNYYRQSAENRDLLNRIIIDDDKGQSQSSQQLNKLANDLNSIKGQNKNDQESIYTDFMILQALHAINDCRIFTGENQSVYVFKVTFERYENIMTDIQFTRY